MADKAKLEIELIDGSSSGGGVSPDMSFDDIKSYFSTFRREQDKKLEDTDQAFKDLISRFGEGKVLDSLAKKVNESDNELLESSLNKLIDKVGGPRGALQNATSIVAANPISNIGQSNTPGIATSVVGAGVEMSSLLTGALAAGLSLYGLSRTIDSLISFIEPISGNIASSNANNAVATLNAQLEIDRYMGKELANLNMTMNGMYNEFMKMIGVILKPMLPLIELMAHGMEGAFEAVEAFVKFLQQKFPVIGEIGEEIEKLNAFLRKQAGFKEGKELAIDTLNVFGGFQGKARINNKQGKGAF